MFGWIATLVNRRAWLVLLSWLALTLVLAQISPPWDTVSRDDDVKFFPPDYPTVIGQDLLEAGFPDDAASSEVVIVLERPDGPLNPEDFAFAQQFGAALRNLSEAHPEWDVKKVETYQTPLIGPRLLGTAIDGSGEAVLTIVRLRTTYLAKRTRQTVDEMLVELDQLSEQAPEGLVLGLTGSSVVGHDANVAVLTSIDRTTWATILLVIGILLIVYRSPLLALIPLATISLSVLVALDGIAMMTSLPGVEFQVINITQVFVVVVLFGAGTDYCLFLIARYREEEARQGDRATALRVALKQVGPALLASACTVMIGLGMLYFSRFDKIQYTGPAIALSLAVALLAALTLAPVLMRGVSALMARLPWSRSSRTAPTSSGTSVPSNGSLSSDRLPPSEPPQTSTATTNSSRFWSWLADLVVTRPVLVLSLSLTPLLGLSWFGLQAKPNYSQLADIDPSMSSVQGSQMIRRYFPVGELSATTVLLRHDQTSYQSAGGRDEIRRISEVLAGVPNVIEVRSLSRPLGEVEEPPTPSNRESSESMPPNGGLLNGLGRLFGGSDGDAPADLREFGQRLFRPLLQSQIDAYYTSQEETGMGSEGRITRLFLVLDVDPFSVQALETLDVVQARLDELLDQPEAPFQVYGLAGASASIKDLATVTRHDQNQMYVLVTLGVYLVLLALLRKPGICLYLIVTVVLGYLASLGMTDLLFRSLQPDESWAGLDWKVGFFLFVILVAVGEDYNIFLMSRVVEEQRIHGVIGGTRRAVAATGGIISSCGLIMAGTFGSMLAGSLAALKQLGFALALGVLVDTFLVRPVLVPAFLALLHRLFGPRSGPEPSIDSTPSAVEDESATESRRVSTLT